MATPVDGLAEWMRRRQTLLADTEQREAAVILVGEHLGDGFEYLDAPDQVVCLTALMRDADPEISIRRRGRVPARV